MTEYERKGIHVGKEQAKEVKRCMLRNQKDEVKRRSMDDRHMKYQQYLERLALTPNEPNVWHTVCRQPLRLSAVSRESVMAPVNAQVNGNQHFSEEFLNFENSEEVLFSSVNEAMAVVAPEEYANIGNVTEKHAYVAHNHGQENVQHDGVSSSVVDKLVNDDTRVDQLEVTHEEVKGSIGGQPDNRSIRTEQATGMNAVSVALASVGMGCRTVGGHAREAASSVEELKHSRKVPVDFNEATCGKLPR
jgi:hypothetical protein